MAGVQERTAAHHMRSAGATGPLQGMRCVREMCRWSHRRAILAAQGTLPGIHQRKRQRSVQARIEQSADGHSARTLGVGGSRLNRRRSWHTGGGARRAEAVAGAWLPAAATRGASSRAPGASAPQPAASASERSAAHLW
jgi:hypothetical protein